MVTTDEEESTEDVVSVSHMAAVRPCSGEACQTELVFITGPNIGLRSLSKATSKRS